ncbi:MucBP domain-containing protein, partial [Enterococcus pallens]
MSKRRKMVYRHEPIKKYRMHKVKKNWVVKGGVAGAMLVSTVAVPASNMVAHATENEVADVTTGEEIGTVASSDPVEEVAQAGNEVANTEVDTTTQQIQPLATENPDGSTTWVAGEDSEASISGFTRVNASGTPIPVTSDSTDSTGVNSGVQFSLVIDNSNNTIEVGDKITIPIVSDRRGISLFSGLGANISGVGRISFVSDNVGFQLTVNQRIENKKEINVTLPGSPVAFVYSYDAGRNCMVAEPINIYVSGVRVRTLNTSRTLAGTRVVRGIGGGGQAVGPTVMAFSHTYTNTTLVSGALPGGVTENLYSVNDEDIIQMTHFSTDSEVQEIYPIYATWSRLYVPNPSGDGSMIDTVVSLSMRTSYTQLELPSDSSDDAIEAALRESGPNSYAFIDKGSGEYTFATNIGNERNGYNIRDTYQYQALQPESPVDFFEKHLGITYTDPNMINAINTIYSRDVISLGLNARIDFEDDSAIHTANYSYTDSIGSETSGSVSTVPNVVAVVSQSSLTANYETADGDTVDVSEAISYGFPDEAKGITPKEIAGYEFVEVQSAPDNFITKEDGTYEYTFTENTNEEVTFIYRALERTVYVEDYLVDAEDQKIRQLGTTRELTGTTGSILNARPGDYRAQGYLLTNPLPQNRYTVLADAEQKVEYLYKEVGMWDYDTTAYRGSDELTGLTDARYTVNANLTTVANLTVSGVPAGYHLEGADGTVYENGATITPADPLEDTVLTLTPNSATITYNFVDSEGEVLREPIVIDDALVGDDIPDMITAIQGYHMVDIEFSGIESAPELTLGRVDSSGEVIIDCTFEEMGSYVFVDENGNQIGEPIKYENNPNGDPRTNNQDQIIPYREGYTPVDENGQPLLWIDPTDEEQGYRAPIVEMEDLSEDTQIRLELNDDESDSDSDSDSD